MEDDRITFLESQLNQARQIAEESDKKYEEVRIREKGLFKQTNKQKNVMCQAVSFREGIKTCLWIKTIKIIIIIFSGF